MHLDVIDLRNFYAGPLGAMARRALGERLVAHWGNVTGMAVLGVGYATPYLPALSGGAERVIAFMPATQGVVGWPVLGPNASALVDETALPLNDATIDRALVVHGLEMSESPRLFLRELWRVLAPGGRVLIVVPNRRGLWAHTDKTPFGHGRPFTRSQLTDCLRGAVVSRSAWSDALHMAPAATRALIGSAGLFDRIGRVAWASFGGVIIVEATKQVYRALPAGEKARGRLALRPVLAPPAAPRRP